MIFSMIFSMIFRIIHLGFACVMGDQWKPFDPESNTGSSFDLTTCSLEAHYRRCIPQNFIATGKNTRLLGRKDQIEMEILTYLFLANSDQKSHIHE